MLALAQALAPDPRLLIIDELSLGLAPAVVEELLDVVSHLKGGGLTTILVEQSVTVALHVASRAVFLEKGMVRFSGAANDLAERERPSPLRVPGGRRAPDPPGYGRPAAGRWRTRADEVLACADLTVRFGGLTAVDGAGPGGAGRRDRRSHRSQRRGQNDAGRCPLRVRHSRRRPRAASPAPTSPGSGPGCGPCPASPARSRTAAFSPA